jgi:diguanylate cyclase (GGDEF)-like protein
VVHRDAENDDLRRRKQAILQNLTAIEAPRVMYLIVLIIVLFDIGYAAVGIYSPAAYYLSDFGQSVVLLAGAYLIASKRIPAKSAPAAFMVAVVANNMATTYQSTIVGQGALGVIALLLAVAGAVALVWRPFLVGSAVCISFTGAVLYLSRPDIWITWTITMVTAAAVSAVILYGRSESARVLAIAQRTIEQAATIDPLTGLFNRRGLAEDANFILGQARRNGDSFFVVFIDVAGLKTVNDRHGHAVGDHLLLRVADSLQANSRASELLCRWGGDEFLLVGIGKCPDPEILRDRLQASIDMNDLNGYWLPGLWVGAAQGAPSTHTVEQVIMLADHDMYARRAGISHADRHS